MSIDTPRHLAFRVYGNFHWPPVRGDFDNSSTDKGKLLRKGVLEVYFVPRRGSADDIDAFLRWKARKAESEPPIPMPFAGEFDTSDVVSIQAANDVLKAAFARDEVIVRLIDGPKEGVEKRRLLFRGAFLFEQFRLDNQNMLSEALLDLRWVLARSYRHYNSDGDFRNTFFSEVVIGQAGDTPDSGSSICFNLALPTPGVQSGDADHRCYALPFAAIFAAKQKMPAASVALQVGRFRAGPGPSDSLRDGSAVSVTATVVDDAQLGKFGFCAGKNAGGLSFLYFPRNMARQFKAFWPTNATAFIEDFLGVLSGSTWARDDLLEIEKDASDRRGELAHSVRFPRESGGASTVMTFRTRVKVGDPWPWPRKIMQVSDDVRVAGWHILELPRPPSFQLRIPGDATKWLDTRTDTLYVEREVAYTIPPEKIWSLDNNGASAGGEIILRLGFAEKGKNYRQPTGGPSADFLPDLFKRAAKALPLPRLDLHNIADGQPQSILPDIEILWPALPDVPWPISSGNPVLSDPETPRFSFCGSMSFAFQSTTTMTGTRGAIAWKKGYPSRKVWAGLDLKLTLWPRACLIGDEQIYGGSPVSVELPIKVFLKSFVYPSTPPNDPLELSLVADPNVRSPDLARWCQFQIIPRNNVKRLQAARLSGIEFIIANNAGGVFLEQTERSFDYSHWRFADRKDPNFGVPSDWQMTDVDLRLRLNIESVRPIATDTPWGDRSERIPPLLFRPGNFTERGNFILDIRETIAAFEDRRLTAAIYSRLGDRESGDYIILSEEPFSIARVRASALRARGSEDNALVATFDSDTRQWRVRLTTPTYYYEFPPQVAGESMDKPRRLELHDLSTNEQLPWDKEMPPAVPPIAVQGDNANPRAVEFRLSPSAEIWIRPSDVERGYFLPEWASHEIFRQRGEYGIGAALAALRVEFLYGLSVGIDPSRENGAARSARVAEIEALTGRPPRRLAVSDTSTASARRWLALDDALARRPERLEIWAREFNSTQPFAPAKFANGATFALRRTALHRPGLDKIYENPSDRAAKVRLSENGLSGGALWALESRNFLNALIQSPSSTGGSIEQIALSPVGGDANQEVEFLNGKVRIISETRNGFVQRHRVEIIGRISVFWHWAKHVVVYERTVNPSAQFTPEGGIHARTRRPVLRKVSEFIYIRQPQGIRRYPDFPNAKPNTVGLLKAVKFNSITINVDSAWSEDIGEKGWRIPLWNRHAARRRPQVYPRPDIAFSAAAEGQGEDAETSQECIEPDNIYFYADASFDTSADTDTWPSRVGIDCSALPPPSHVFQRCLDDDGSGDGTQTKASAPRIPRGHRRFTWRLAPPSKMTMLNAGRSEKPLYAGLDSITFMRSNAEEMVGPVVGSPPPVNPEALKKAIQCADAKVAAPKVNVREKLPIWTPHSRPPAQFEIHGSPSIVVGDALDKFLAATAAAQNDLTGIRRAAASLGGELKKIRSALTTDPILSEYANAAKGNADQLAALEQFAKDPPERCKQLASDFVCSIKRKELLILDAVRTWESYANEIVPNDPPINKAELIDTLVKSLEGRIASAMVGVGADIGQANTGIEKARDALYSFQSDLAEAQSELRLKLAGFKASYVDGKPWSESRIGDLQDKLTVERERAFHAVRTAIEEVQVRLTSELDGFAHGVANVLQHQMDTIVVDGQVLEQAFASRWKLLDGYLAQARKRIHETLDDDGRDRFEEIEAKLVDLKAKVTGHDADLDAILYGLRRVEQLLLDVESWLATMQMDVPTSVISTISEAVQRSQDMLASISLVAADAFVKLNALRVQISDPAAMQSLDSLVTVLRQLDIVGRKSLIILRDVTGAIDGAIDDAAETAVQVLDRVARETTDLFLTLDDESARLETQIERLRDAIGPGAVGSFIARNALRPAIEQALYTVNDQTLLSYTDVVRERIKDLIADTSQFVQQRLERLTEAALAAAETEIGSLCGLFGGGLKQGYYFLNDMVQAVDDRVDAINEQINAILDSADNDQAKIRKLQKFAEGFASDVRQISNDIATSYATAQSFTNRVLESAGNFGSGGLGTVPGNILRLYAATASAPALPNLDFARDRLGYYYNQVNDIIDTTPVEAWFGRLGDELKALGLSLPFRKMGDNILPDDLSNFDISRVLKNFSGMKLDKLFQGYKLPPGAKDAIRISHAFDAEHGRAWVEIDVDLPMTERKAMFSIGPFELDYVESRLNATVRLEASKDTDKFDETGSATLTTNLEAVVSGETMVSFRQVVLRYEKSKGLKVDFDPKKIRLNAIFQFIQDTLGSIFPNEIGGLKVIKANNIPVGVEHVFSMPPLDLNFVTSGVSHIVIDNRFGLVAFPNFVIFDRFCLSRPELPFIFSIFIIGGTGYISIDTEYRPFEPNGLMVTVDAAAGGSAQIGFAFGPVNGAVFIALSVALIYTKRFGKLGGGLSVALVLVVAGNVCVAGIVNIYIGVLLRMTYRDDGAIDATGTLSLRVQITRFFKISVSTNVQYRLRGGKSQAGATMHVSARSNALADAKVRANKLLAGRG